MLSDRRPSFARDFPRTAALDELVEAFARGDYARVRAEGPRLAGSAQEQSVRDAALRLVARTAPDPLAVWLLVLTGALLVALSTYWIARGRPPSHGAANAPRSQSTREATRAGSARSTAFAPVIPRPSPRGLASRLV